MARQHGDLVTFRQKPLAYDEAETEFCATKKDPHFALAIAYTIQLCHTLDFPPRLWQTVGFVTSPCCNFPIDLVKRYKVPRKPAKN